MLDERLEQRLSVIERCLQVIASLVGRERLREKGKCFPHWNLTMNFTGAVRSVPDE